MSELQKITERNLVASPFLNQLPGDVRNLIYEFVLGGNTWDFTRNGTLINHVAKADRNDHRALLRVCRQIYNETRVLPWSLCIFSCHGLKQVRLWAAKFPPVYRRAIKSIILKIGMEDSAPTVSKEVLEQTWGSRVEIGAQDFPKLTSLRVHIKDPNNGGKHGQHLYGRLGVQECYRVADGAGDVHLSMELVDQRVTYAVLKVFSLRDEWVAVGVSELWFFDGKLVVFAFAALGTLPLPETASVVVERDL